MKIAIDSTKYYNYMYERKMASIVVTVQEVDRDHGGSKPSLIQCYWRLFLGKYSCALSQASMLLVLMNEFKQLFASVQLLRFIVGLSFIERTFLYEQFHFINIVSKIMKIVTDSKRNINWKIRLPPSLLHQEPGYRPTLTLLASIFRRIFFCIIEQHRMVAEFIMFDRRLS